MLFISSPAFILSEMLGKFALIFFLFNSIIIVTCALAQAQLQLQRLTGLQQQIGEKTDNVTTKIGIYCSTPTDVLP